FFSRPTNNRSILAFLASQRSAQARQRAVPCAINLPLAARSLARGMFAAQIPIAEPAARPTEAYLPRFRALAVFERRPPERVDSSSLPASENLHISGLVRRSKPRTRLHGLHYSITSS